MKYIDVDKLLAELDTERKDWLIAQNEFKDDDPELAAFYEGKVKKCAELYYYINSLQQEQQKVNWEEEDELEREINNAGMAMTDHVPSWKEIEQFACHFYELGLNARR